MVSTATSLTLMLSSSNSTTFSHYFEYSEFITSENIAGTVAFMGGIEKTAFSNILYSIYYLEINFQKRHHKSLSCL